MIQDTEDWERLEWDLLKNINVAENILITGAGFTRDFGGFLAEEMWSQIYNHPRIRSCPKVARRMREDFNYESVYHNVLKGEGEEYKDSDQQAIEAAVFDAYLSLDEETRDHTRERIYKTISLNGVEEMLSLFENNQGKIGFFFTLNQDIFIERHFTVELPWIKKVPRGVAQLDQSRDYEKLPTEDELQDLKKKIPLSGGRLTYIKLHGSLNWLDHDGKRRRIIIGMDKEDEIAREPLLHLYDSVFKMIMTKAKKLLVIGYGFMDKHINKAIALAMADCHNPELELYVISPQSPSTFMKNMTWFDENNKLTAHGDFLVNRLSGYFPYRLSEVFPSSGETHVWKMIRKSVWSY